MSASVPLFAPEDPLRGRCMLALEGGPGRGCEARARTPSGAAYKQRLRADPRGFELLTQNRGIGRPRTQADPVSSWPTTMTLSSATPWTPDTQAAALGHRCSSNPAPGAPFWPSERRVRRASSRPAQCAARCPNLPPMAHAAARGSGLTKQSDGGGQLEVRHMISITGVRMKQVLRCNTSGLRELIHTLGCACRWRQPCQDPQTSPTAGPSDTKFRSRESPPTVARFRPRASRPSSRPG